MMLNFNRKPIHSEKRIDSEQNAPLFLTSSDQTHEKSASRPTSARAALEDTYDYRKN
jgi:hypothetical protein